MKREAIVMKEKLKVGIIGATGYVGQRFITLLADHPWFEVTSLIASERSAGKRYEEAVGTRWKLSERIPENLRNQPVLSVSEQDQWAESLDFVFCAVDMKKAELIALEESIAKLELPVVSNNSANRWTPDVPMIIPEINPEHSQLIDVQRKRLKTSRGFIVVKPNCSIQSYVPALTPLRDFGLEQLFVSTYQAISGAGKTFTDWPEMIENVIPYIGGEEEKSEQEPLRIWGVPDHEKIVCSEKPQISAHCYRVAVQEGHTAAVTVKFRQKPDQAEIIERWQNYEPSAQAVGLPSAPKPFLTYFSEENRPQAKLDNLVGKGMGIAIGRLRPDEILDYRFTCLSHNTIRGAAGGAILTAELLVHQGYIDHR